MRLFKSKSPRSPSVNRSTDAASSLAHALTHLEKRYVFDAALVTQLTDTSDVKTIATTDAFAGPTLGDTLVQATQSPSSVDPAAATDVSSLAALETSAAAPSHAVYFVDAKLGQKDVLLAGLPAGADIVVLDPARDGVVQIAEALTGRTGVDAIHIFAHGSEGELSLGSSVLDAAGMNGVYRATLASIASHLSDTADILVYGCNFAEGTAGAAAADLLAAITGADVAASTDLTGSASYNGDWTLEYHSGSVESDALAFSAFEGALEVATISASGLPTTNGLHNVGASATWANVATVGGNPVDIRATVTSADASATITFGTTGDDLRMELENGTATVLWELFLAGTTTPVTADVNFQITDLDGPNIESVSATANFVIDSNTNLSVSNVGALITAAGTQNQNSEPTSMIRFSWTGVSSLSVDYTATSGNDIRIFNHDGDLDLAFSSPVVVGTPLLDLDATNIGNDYVTSFTEGGSAVSITDATVSITNSTNIQSATIVLTNAQAADTLTLGTLPGGITGTVNTSVPGQITVTLTGTTTAANYETAMHNITFSNSSITPDTTPRTVTFDLQNIAFSSITSTTTIEVIPVNDAPIAVNDSFTTSVNTVINGAVTSNDSDPNGDALSYTVLANPSNGTLTLNSTGIFTYTPNPGYAGNDSFTYTASDGNGGTDTATVSILVNGPPVAGDDAVTTATNTAVSASVIANDTDPNGQTLTYTVLANPTHGTVTLASNGSYTYTPTTGYAGTDTFTYTANDGFGGTDTATVTVTITNAAPVAGDDVASTAFNTAVSATVAANDTDANSDPLTYTVLANPANGTVTLASNGSYTYTPTSGYSGTDTFTYTVSDGNGGTDTATVTITVGVAPNTAPVAGDDTASTAYNTPVSGSVATNDTDADGNPLTYTVLANPTHGTVTLASNGSYTYTPVAGYSGPDTFTYTVNDGNGGTDTATVTITIANAPPVAGNDTAATPYNTAISGTVATNDSDPNGDPLTYLLTVNPTHGTVTMGADGSYFYTPTSGYSGPDSFSYSVSDGNGGTATATMTVTVGNGAPVAGDDTATTPYNTAVAGSVATNDSDPNGDPLTYTVLANPTHGTVVLNASGSYTYTPTSGYSGPDSFTYTVSDGNGGTATATVSITIGNAPPLASDDVNSTAYNTAVSGSVATNDSDPNGDPLTYTVLANPTHGTVTLAANGSYTYTPTSGYSGTDTFTYTVSDGNGGTATATATITIGNAPPVAGDDANSTPYNTAVSGTVATNDSDPNGDTLSYAVLANPVHGTVTMGAGGAYTYTPTSGYSGTDTFTYTVSDGNGGTDTATVTITIGNAPPVAANDTYTTPYNTALNGDVGVNDSDPNGDTLAFTLVTGATKGTVMLNPNGTFSYLPSVGMSGADSFTYSISDGNGGTATATANITIANAPPIAADDSAATAYNTAVSSTVATNDSDPNGDTLSYAVLANPTHGTVTLNANGSYTYTPTAGYSGTDSFTYTASDGNGGTATATATITIANAPPVAGNDVASTPYNTTLAGTVATNDSDPNGDTLSYSVLANPVHGTVAVSSNGSYTYIPNVGYSGADSFTYTVSDGKGGTATATVAITIANAAPVAANDTATAAYNTPVSGTVASNDSDPNGDTLTYAVATNPTHGTVTLNANGTYTYTPTSGYNGADSFTYTVSDGNGGTATATVNLTVTPRPNIAPTLVNDTAITNPNTAVSGTVATNDSDADGDTLTYAVATNPTHGTVTLNANGTYTYTPTAGYSGPDSFTYTANDGFGGISTATVTITVNSPPITVGTMPTQACTDASTLALNSSAYFTDANGGPLTYVASGLPAGLTIDPNTGLISGTIDRSASVGGPGRNGVYTVTVSVTDPGGLSTSQSFVWNVTNPGPVAGADTFNASGSQALSGTVATNDSDPDGDALTYALATQPGHGTIVFKANGTFTYTARDLFSGVDTFTYRVTDADGAVSTATVTINVAAPTVLPPKVSCLVTFGDLSYLRRLLSA